MDFSCRRGSIAVADFPESRVVQLWQECRGRDGLETEEDGPVQIIYPGRVNDDCGADFRDAVIATEQGILTGDIEVHVRSSCWRAHRHHRDPLYNRVVLHVVYHHDTVHPARLENGRTVPTLALDRLFSPGEEQAAPPLSPLPCRRSAGRLERDTLFEIIDMAGDRRFQSRAAGFQTVSSRTEAGQALYRGIMAALGYARNKHPMTALAGHVPLRRLEKIITECRHTDEYPARCRALLTGTAGLLPSQRALSGTDDFLDPWMVRLQKIWADHGEPAAMSERDWRFFRVRPGNSPVRRIAAMARLLARYREKGLLPGLLEELEIAVREGNHRRLEEALMVGPEVNEEHCPGHGASFRRSQPALLGRGRAADIVVNVLLPFATAWGRINSRPELAEGAAGLYRAYPALAGNTIERHMSLQLGIEPGPVSTIRRQQGLLNIFREFCSAGGCHVCPVSQAVSPVLTGIR